MLAMFLKVASMTGHDLLCTVGTYDVQQGIFVRVLDGKALVELPHEGRLVDECKATKRMHIAKVLLDDLAQESRVRRESRGDEPGNWCVSKCFRSQAIRPRRLPL